MFQLLETFRFLRPESFPILVVREVQTLAKLGERGKRMLHNLLSSLGTTKQRTSSTPWVILETSDSYWVHQTAQFHDSKGNAHSFERYEVGPMEREAAEAAVVYNWNFLTLSQFDDVWRETHGYGSLIAAVLQKAAAVAADTRVTPPLSDGVIRRCLRKVLDTHHHWMTEALTEALQHLRTETPQRFDQCVKKLQELERNNWQLPVGGWVHEPAALFLVRQNILYVRRCPEQGAVMTPQHDVFKELIHRWLNEQWESTS